MPLESPRDLLIHELSDTMSAEHMFLGMLPKLADEAQHPDARKAFKAHEAETRGQIENLDKVFEQLGTQPEKTTCYAAEGLAKEHDALRDEKPTPMVLEMGDLGAAAKTEHYEIASYTMLVRMAKDLGERDVARLLQENLDQEKAMAKQVEAFAKELGKEAKEAMKAEAK
jgi:ferritin-like metal-binding protein YciE